jgi:hypothetical protein
MARIELLWYVLVMGYSAVLNIWGGLWVQYSTVWVAVVLVLVLLLRTMRSRLQLHIGYFPILNLVTDPCFVSIRLRLF